MPGDADGSGAACVATPPSHYACAHGQRMRAWHLLAGSPSLSGLSCQQIQQARISTGVTRQTVLRESALCFTAVSQAQRRRACVCRTRRGLRARVRAQASSSAPPGACGPCCAVKFVMCAACPLGLARCARLCRRRRADPSGRVWVSGSAQRATSPRDIAGTGMTHDGVTVSRLSGLGICDGPRVFGESSFCLKELYDTRTSNRARPHLAQYRRKDAHTTRVKNASTSRHKTGHLSLSFNSSTHVSRARAPRPCVPSSSLCRRRA